MNTIKFKHIITTLPIVDSVDVSIEEREENLEKIAQIYQEKTGIELTEDYQLHLLSIKSLLQWEETVAVEGAFRTATFIHETFNGTNPLRQLMSTLMTGRVHKQLVLLQIGHPSEVDKISDRFLRTEITSFLFIE